MEYKIRLIWLLLITLATSALSETVVMPSPDQPSSADVATTLTPQDTVEDLIVLLENLADNSSHELFKRHCRSIIEIIEAKPSLSPNEMNFINLLYSAFTDTRIEWSAAELSSYLARKRPFILAWESPSDGAVSSAWVLPPENWDPDKTYPLYVRLHGLWDPYSNQIQYMTVFLQPESVMNTTFEDGYSLFPWGRGNMWYEGQSETDVWEAIDALEEMVSVNPARKYLVGFSMGGYGAWYIGHRSPQTWAAVGVYAGALSYGGQRAPITEAAEKLKDVPVFIICGDQDGLLTINQRAYELLQATGNENIEFVTFHGGHEAPVENWRQMYGWIRQFTNKNVTGGGTDDDQNVTGYNLLQNYPNPFNAKTRITFTLPQNSPVSLAVYNVNGKKIAGLVNEVKAPGEYQVAFNATGFPSAVYFCRMRAGSYSSVIKMMAVK